MPLLRQEGFHIAPGTENQIAVTPFLTHTTQSALSRFSPEERDCYKEDEILLKYLPPSNGYRYAIGNCLFEAALENILEKCNCYPGYNLGLVKDHNLDLKPCIGSNITCMNNILYRIGHFDHVNVEGKMMKCRPSCEDQMNTMTVTTSAYPNKNTFRYRNAFCYVIQRLLQKCKGSKRRPLEKSYPNICSTLEPLNGMEENDYCINNRWTPNHRLVNCTQRHCPMEEMILEYSRKNLLMFHVLIKDPYAQRFKRDEKMPISSFIANLGGLLGLWLGFSVISGAEVLFHTTRGMLLFLSKRNKNKERITHPAKNVTINKILEMQCNADGKSTISLKEQFAIDI